MNGNSTMCSCVECQCFGSRLRATGVAVAQEPECAKRRQAIRFVVMLSAAGLALVLVNWLGSI
jgi:hypothetical protein